MTRNQDNTELPTNAWYGGTSNLRPEIHPKSTCLDTSGFHFFWTAQGNIKIAKMCSFPEHTKEVLNLHSRFAGFSDLQYVPEADKSKMTHD